MGIRLRCWRRSDFQEAVDGYQVNFQVPAGTAKGPATVQVSAAWITEAVLSCGSA
jgi:hypothetical protein